MREINGPTQDANEMSHTRQDSAEGSSRGPRATQTVEKFEVLLDHWIEHNAVHAAEFEKWAQQARDAGLDEVSQDIFAAADGLREITTRLRDAMAHLKRGRKGEGYVSE